MEVYLCLEFFTAFWKSYNVLLSNVFISGRFVFVFVCNIQNLRVSLHCYNIYRLILNKLAITQNLILSLEILCQQQYRKAEPIESKAFRFIVFFKFDLL